MLEQLIIGTVIIAFNVIFHVGGLLLIWLLISKRHIEKHKNNYPIAKTTLVFAIIVLLVIILHSASIWGWGAIYLYLGEFKTISQAVYFSAATITTVGYGDVILSEKWQILGTFEAMGGMIFFGISTAFFVGFVRKILS